MRIEISYKFILGFLLVVGSVVFMDMLVPLLGVAEEFQSLVSTTSAIVVGLLLGVWFSKAFTSNFQQVNAGVNRLSRGDLTGRIEVKQPLFADETVEVAEAINQIIVNLRDVVSMIRSTSESVASSSHQLSFTTVEMTESAKNISDTVEKIAEGAIKQSDMVDKVFKHSKGVALSADISASSAKKLVASADLTSHAARQGGESAKLTAEMLKKMLRDIAVNEERMIAFSAQLQKIGKFSELIHTIANKTNMLSLNATIEAARAGEYGHGFAALADEIRKLSDSTNASTDEITLLVETIREENRIILASMTSIVEQIDEGYKAIDGSSQVFAEIMNHASTTQDKASGIFDLSQQQVEGVRGIVIAMDEISSVVTTNANAIRQAASTTTIQSNSMKEVADSARNLNTLATDLMEFAKCFQVDELNDLYSQKISEPEETNR